MNMILYQQHLQMIYMIEYYFDMQYLLYYLVFHVLHENNKFFSKKIQGYGNIYQRKMFRQTSVLWIQIV